MSDPNNDDVDEDLANANLDHALLESLFYNEMMMLASNEDNFDDSISSSLLTSTLNADGGLVTNNHDANGGDDSPFAAGPPAAPPPPWNDQSTPLPPLITAGDVDGSSSGSIPLSYSSSPITMASAAGTYSTLPSNGSKTHTKRTSSNKKTPQPTPSSLSVETKAAAIPTAAAATTMTTTTPWTAFSSRSAKNGSAATAASSAPPARSAPSPVPNETHKREKLVAQFATLASRLGIALPAQVLQSLNLPPPPPPPSLRPHQMQNSPDAEDEEEELPLPPAVQQLQSSAEAAIAAVEASRLQQQQQRRPSDDSTVPHSTSNASLAGKRSGSSASLNTNTAKGAPRRKKPRLQDCESKLASLRAENATLKRHLANLSKQTSQFDAERRAHERRMRDLLAQTAAAAAPHHPTNDDDDDQGTTAAPEPSNNNNNDNNDRIKLSAQLDECVRNFTELYSDYGRRRHSELAFHLLQLQRLVHPTNLTKMTLWTLGQPGSHSSSSENSGHNVGDGGGGGGADVANNGTALSTTEPHPGGGGHNNNGPHHHHASPLAGILQRELDISSAQGRKIVEQRQKIQRVCANLKECHMLLAKLKTLCEQKTQIFHDRMTKCREILTPRQVVQLIVWIDEHSSTLGSVCPGWGSEQIRSHNKTTSVAALSTSTIETDGAAKI